MYMCELVYHDAWEEAREQLGSFGGLVLSFHHEGPGDQTQAVRLGIRCSQQLAGHGVYNYCNFSS